MALAAHPAATRDHFASFQVISSGGAPLPPALVEKFRAGFGPYLRNGYGLTECTAPCASVPPGARRPRSTRPPAPSPSACPGPDTVVRIVDEQGEDVPFGEQGEIAVSGPQVVPGYWRLPEATAEAFPDGELRTGDIGFMDADGWLYVVDRKKDMINASGFKVWPREVEDVLYTHPAVREAAVVGVPDAYRGETVKAYVSLRPGAAADPAELAAYCAERLAAYKYPREVEILPELPKTTSGKILRRELRFPRVSQTRVTDVNEEGRWRQWPGRRTGTARPVPQRLLAAATRLFAERGYDRTSVQEIVEAAGVTKGALYHYFGSKDDLLHEVYARVLRLQQERLDAFADADAPVEERLRGAAADVVVTTIDNLDDATIFFRSMHHLSPEKNKQVRAERRRYHERFRALVEEGQRSGRLLHGHPGRPGGGLPLRLGPPPVAPGTARTARSPRSRSPTTWRTCCCARCARSAAAAARQPPAFAGSASAGDRGAESVASPPPAHAPTCTASAPAAPATAGAPRPARPPASASAPPPTARPAGSPG